MPSSNPAFKDIDKALAAKSAPNAAYLQQMYDQPTYAGPQAPARTLTLDDVVAKTATVLAVAIIAGGLTAYFEAFTLMIPALVVGLVLSLIIIFKRSTNPALILSYAAAEGVLLGGITGWIESIGPQYKGIALQAIVGTLGVFVGMIFVYKTGVIRVTPKFTKILIGSMIGVLALMVFNMVASWMFHFDTGLRSGGPIAIIFSIVCIGIAALSFLLDFDQIDKAMKVGVPAKYAWYFAFGLMVTLVWLYLEILRLLSYMRN
ncbi:MAG: Bax inhibitor-1/YccA family protein [Nakamurella sp.]